MANPQAESGHTDIANEIMEALAKIRIPGEARQILDVILRKTYGWHKKEDVISLSQFAECTNLSKVHICQAIKKLIEMNIVTKKGNASSLFTKFGNDIAVSYSFQKDYEKWITLPKKVTLPKTVMYVTEKGNQTLPNSGTTKEKVTKETIQKKLKELSKSFDSFYQAYPKHDGKKKAFDSWQKLNPSPELIVTILQSLEMQKQNPQWLKENGQFIPLPATWLNGRRWEDEGPQIKDWREW